MFEAINITNNEKVVVKILKVIILVNLSVSRCLKAKAPMMRVARVCVFAC